MRTLLLSCAALALMAAALPADTTTPADPTVQIKKWKEQIEAQNLINGLCLTDEQLASLTTLSLETRVLREELLDARKGLVQRYLDSMDRLRQALAAGPEIPPDVAQSFHQAEQAVKEAMFDYEREASSRAKRVSTILTPEQIEVVRTFKPCMLPPKDQKEPVRAGQSSENLRAEKMLDRVREMDEARFEMLKGEMAGRAVEAYEAGHQPFTDEERAAETERIAAEIVRIRAMDEAEYQMNKREIAAAIHPRDRAKELGEEAALIRSERLGGDSDRERLVKFFLSDGACAALEAKLAFTKGYQPAQPTDLGKIDPAENCEDGSCALEDDKPASKKPRK